MFANWIEDFQRREVHFVEIQKTEGLSGSVVTAVDGGADNEIVEGESLLISFVHVQLVYLSYSPCK